jgi:thymidylate synthase (FAD)
MNVTLIANTTLARYWVENRMDVAGVETDPDILAEFAGRTCYLSYDKPNPATRANEDYLANIIGQQHESVLEHSSASFYVDGVSRNMLLELERHRFLSFSVVSTRYVDASKLSLVTPPGYRDLYPELPATVEWDSQSYNDDVQELLAAGKTRKQARETAIASVPGSLETRFVVTGNFRAWRDVLRKRNNPAANAEIRLFAQEVLRLLKDIAPNSFQDMEIS